MKRAYCGFLLLAGLLIVCASCQESETTHAPASPSLAGDRGPDKGPSGWCDPEMHAFLEEFWQTWEHAIWTEISGYVDVETGGVLAGVPAGWPPDYQIALEIKPRSVSSHTPGYPRIFFRILVPKTGPGFPPKSVPYILEPDGLEFLLPARLTICWPEWAGPPSTSGYHVLCLKEVQHDGHPHYAFTDNEMVLPTGPAHPSSPVMSLPLSLGTGITRNITHFSRWELVNGDNTGDGGGGKLDDEEDGCWTPFAP
jgi:hypothetical protein